MSIADTSGNPPAQLTNKSKSNLWFYPGEKLDMGEMRVTLMGTGWGNVVSPSQKGPSIYVELGNENEDAFVFDVGPGCILNYNAMEIPMSKMNRVFLSHLHMDHCSDLPFIFAFGPNLGDRYVPLNIYGPSGPNLLDDNGDPTSTVLGTKNMVEGMKQFTQWHTTSFATMTSGANSSYQIIDDPKDKDQNLFEFDFKVCGGIAFESGQPGKENDHIVIKHFPAVHIIDGAVSYRLEWSPAGQDEYITLVYSGDTLPNDFMIEYGAKADLMIHETAPSVELVMNGAGSTEDEAIAIVSNSHTPAKSLGNILSLTKPGLGVTTHSPMDIRSVESLITDVHKGFSETQIKNKQTDELNYQVGADLMVFNLVRLSGEEKVTITTRMAALLDRAWPVRIVGAPDTDPPLEPFLGGYRSSVPEQPITHDPDPSGTTIFQHEIDTDEA